METFGDFLKRMRTKEYTQRELAIILKVGYPYISKLEANIEQNPSERLLLDIAELFKLEPATVFLKAKRIPEKWLKEIVSSPKMFNALEMMLEANAKDKQEEYISFQKYFENSSKSMLLIDPKSAEIMDANESSLSFYGYSKHHLLNKTVFDLNIQSETEIRDNINSVCNNEKHTFDFIHKLSTGQTKDIFVMSELVSICDQPKLLSIIVEK